MKKIILISLLGLAVWSCKNKETWSYESEKRMIDKCIQAAELDENMQGMLGLEEYCNCTTHEIMKKHSEEDMKKMAMLEKELMNDMVDAAYECIHHLKTK